MDHQLPESDLARYGFDGFMRALASSDPAPGGGAAAAVAGALAAALVEMVAGLTVGRDEYASVAGRMSELLELGSELRQRLLSLADADSRAYLRVTDAYRLPKDDEGQRMRRQSAVQDALREATEVPLQTAVACVQVLDLAAEAATSGNRNASSDAAVSALLAHAALQGAALNVRINLASIKDQAYRAATNDQLARLLDQGSRTLDRARRSILPGA